MCLKRAKVYTRLALSQPHEATLFGVHEQFEYIFWSAPYFLFFPPNFSTFHGNLSTKKYLFYGKVILSPSGRGLLSLLKTQSIVVVVTVVVVVLAVVDLGVVKWLWLVVIIVEDAAVVMLVW